MGTQLYPMRTNEQKVYEMQVRDKACTICVNVGIGGKICDECGEARKNWQDAFGEKEG